MLDATKLAALQALADSYRGQADDIQAAVDLHTAGYQSDQTYITTQIQAGIDAAVAAATTPLNEQIVLLQTQVSMLPPS